MKVLVSGASGLVGSALIPFLTTGGHRVTRLVRKARLEQGRKDGTSVGEAEVAWSPAAGTIERTGLEGFDAVVHLAGENIAAGRWTPERKRRIRDSRVKGTRLLCQALTQCAQPPRVFVGASAIGYYGDRGDETLSEESAVGEGFLAEVCRDWEGRHGRADRCGDTDRPAAGRGCPQSCRRSAEKNAAAFSARPGRRDWRGQPVYELYCPGRRCGGDTARHNQRRSQRSDQYGVSRGRDESGIYPDAGDSSGPSDSVPCPGYCGPACVLGEMADALLLASTRVEPRILLRTGYEFRYPRLESALRHVLGKEVGAGRSE